MKSPWANVDDAHDAEDHGQADAHQAVDGAEQDAGHQRLQEVLGENGKGHWPPTVNASKLAKAGVRARTGERSSEQTHRTRMLLARLCAAFRRPIMILPVVGFSVVADFCGPAFSSSNDPLRYSIGL